MHGRTSRSWTKTTSTGRPADAAASAAHPARTAQDPSGRGLPCRTRTPPGGDRRHGKREAPPVAPVPPGRRGSPPPSPRPPGGRPARVDGEQGRVLVGVGREEDDRAAGSLEEEQVPHHAREDGREVVPVQRQHVLPPGCTASSTRLSSSRMLGHPVRGREPAVRAARPVPDGEWMVRRPINVFPIRSAGVPEAEGEGLRMRNSGAPGSSGLRDGFAGQGGGRLDRRMHPRGDRTAIGGPGRRDRDRERRPSAIVCRPTQSPVGRSSTRIRRVRLLCTRCSKRSRTVRCRAAIPSIGRWVTITARRPGLSTRATSASDSS